MPEQTNDLPLPIYKSRPPQWLPPIHSTADLGYPGFYPPRPSQDEDALTETNVKNGFVLDNPVSAESFSASAMINTELHSNDSLSKLADLMSEAFTRRVERIPPVPPSSYRIPTRVTLNDAKRQAWFADLANPDVPLYKLGKSVPHGAKGQDLLDLLHSNNVAIPRAVWFLRVFGANETAGLRNKPGYNPTQYSVDWANVVTGYMKKQLTEIALPSAPRPGVNIKHTFKSVLADSDTRERWISRFTYCLKLLRTFYTEGLVDHKTFLTWIVQQTTACNLAQAGFLTRLADEYLDDIMRSRALSRPLVEACASKLAEIKATSAQEYLHDTEHLLKILLQRFCLNIPDAFISPRLWMAYSELLGGLMIENLTGNYSGQGTDQNIIDIQRSLHTNYLDIARRNEAMLFRSAPSQVSARLATAVWDVKLLNSISRDTDMQKVQFFGSEFDDTPKFKDKLDMLLTWSVTPLQYGDHRPFAAATLIRIWRDRACERATRRDFKTPTEFLQDQLFDWLDSSEIAEEPSNIRAVALLYGKLVKHELFSYANYIQRLIARAETGLSFNEATESRHRRFLTWIPLLNSSISLINQRKAILYGIRAREIPEEGAERSIRKEIRSVLPELFGGEEKSIVISTTALLAHCNTLISASRFEQVRSFRQWLLPLVRKSIIRQKLESNALHKIYCISVELMAYTKCFHCILDLALCMLEHTTSSELLIGIIDSLHRYATIWACMDMLPAITLALDTAHQQWKSRGTQSRPLLTLLMEFDNGRYLGDTSRERILSDIAFFTHQLQPTADQLDEVPDTLPEVLLLNDDPNPAASSLLANALWIKYRSSDDWAWKVWDNVVTNVRLVSSIAANLSSRRACALRYGNFLWHVDQHLTNGLDDDISRWFIGPGKNIISALTSDAWDILTFILLYLAVHGSVKATTILSGLVYPAWCLGASLNSVEHEQVSETYLRAANSLCHHLLFQEDGSGDEMPPVNIFDVQCIRTRRQVVYCEPHFTLLVTNIPILIHLESNDLVSQDLRDESRSLRYRICRDPGFRQGAYRNLDIIKEAFENSPHLLNTNGAAHSKHVISGLRMILYDSAEEVELYDWPEVTCLLSPWKIVATTIQMQFMMKQLGRALVQDNTRETASASLDKLTLMLFHHTKTSEEACYVGEMARGADTAVAGKFINNGLNCMAQILLESAPSGLSVQSGSLDRLGELLRVLIHVAHPLREDSILLPQLEHIVQDEVLNSLFLRISQFESTYLAHVTQDESHRIKGDLVLLMRLLQFTLGFRGVWSSRSKEVGSKLCDTLFQLLIRFADGDALDFLLYPVIVDSLLYLYDEIPQDSKGVSFDPFRHYPSLPVSELPTGLPAEYRKQIISLLPYQPVVPTISNLVNSHKDMHGNVVFGSPVINRPWEWIENLGEPTLVDAKEGRQRHERGKVVTSCQIKNSASLPLENFGVQLTGANIIRNISAGYDSRSKGNIQSLEDGLPSDGIFARDWRETRVDPDSVSLPSSRSEMSQEISGHSTFKRERRGVPRGSPTSSVISRPSALGSSVRRSPTQASHSHASNSTVSEIIDVDSLSNATSRKDSSKRKAAVVVTISDDEIEIVEGPVPPAKKARISKSKAKKK
ncbi:hypothetical protein BDQ17DRAFT_1430355 [Cyathus striatus]|nr:hypothetical protein BDQ17DRAFT_1430355 [Cyathus striatus]